MRTISDKLTKIITKYNSITVSDSNYDIGGGLSNNAFASRRHEDAKYDISRITLGKANQLFSKATGLSVQEVEEIIVYTIPNMEWHHAGKLPKSYGGGMKKTYFLNSEEIVNIAENFNDNLNKLNLDKLESKRQLEIKQNKILLQNEFLNENAIRIERTTIIPKYFYKTSQEMNGKYGWFDSTYKDYNLTEYYSGWEFDTEDKYNKFLSI